MSIDNAEILLVGLMSTPSGFITIFPDYEGIGDPNKFHPYQSGIIYRIEDDGYYICAVDGSLFVKDIKIFVNDGSVLLTGKVKKPSEKIELTKLAWTVKGVNEVNNELQITDTSLIKNIARDLASMGEIRARIMSDKTINSINFSIDVVNDKAYLSGVASSKEEMLLVKEHASSARFVKEVYNYIILNDDKR